MLVLRFVETRYFTAQVQEIRGDEPLRELELLLSKNPETGDVVAGTGGLRKVRLKLPGRGKSGSARVVYLLLRRRPCIVFVYLYTKARQTDLSPEEKKALRKVAEDIEANQHLIP